jgi:predicted amidohydrolase
MPSFRAAALQLRTGRSVAENTAATETLVRQAAGLGAAYVLTPEMTTILERDRERLLSVLAPEEEDPALRRFRALAHELGIHLHIGSLAVRCPDGLAANRSLVIGPDGGILARYDKIHLFDVDLRDGESWRESRTYRGGREAVVVDLPFARLGLSICYDVRFPLLYRVLARAGSSVFAVPSAFTRATGEAHWHVLLRARAIETGSFVIAAAQGGRHEDGRETFGHTLIVDPWGRVLAECDGQEPGAVFADIDPEESARVRARIPAITLEAAFSDPEIEVRDLLGGAAER